MLISDPETKPQIIVFPQKKGKWAHLRQYYALYLILLMVATVTIWLGQQSINGYWLQTYHRASPLEPLNQFAAWRAGADVQNRLTSVYQQTLDGFQQYGERWQTNLQSSTTEKTPPPPVQATVAVASAASLAPSASAVAAASEVGQPENQDGIQLQAGDKVLFAGDSIMQGIAPHLQKWLKSQYQVDSINLSKQSTGLAYPKLFDWPATIEQTFANDKNVKLLIILVGANDPWDFPDPVTPKGVPYLKFQTPAWEKVYLERVNRIVQAADKAGAKIIWLGIPHMKRSVLNEQMNYLDKLLTTELHQTKSNVLWLNIRDLLSDGEKVYRDTIVLDGTPVKIRTPDGIHFTVRGQQFMADYIASYINAPNTSSGSLKTP